MTIVSIKNGYCPTHDIVWAGSAGCPACAAAQRRDEMNMLKAQADDQGQEILALRRRLHELYGIVEQLQRGYTALAHRVSPDRFLA